LEIIHALAPFLDYFKKLIQKKNHMMLALMLDPRFKDIFILNNYVGIEKNHNCNNKV